MSRKGAVLDRILLYLVFGVGGLALGVFTLVVPQDPEGGRYGIPPPITTAASLILGAVFLVMGIRELVKRRRESS